MRDVDIPNWLKGLPLAPEFRPTDTEFADPIAYISKIEKEAGAFGICKVIPPLPKPSKKFVLSNLNNSLSKCPELGLDVNLSGVSSSSMDNGDKGYDGEVRAVFTTRHQELGQSGKRTKGAVQPPTPAVHKQVWQSGEIYTLEQFESKSKAFARIQLGMVKEVSPLVIESLFWKAASEKPIYIEYANDVPGSGFGEPEGSFRYFHRRRRRRRTFIRGDSNSKKEEAETLSNNDESKGASAKYNPDSSETPKATTCLPNMLSDRTSRLSGQKSSNAGNEMEGTSGWKLSNSPWNLQVIARSPGSLTRFMPDDIPGVTSPMVYIGMLFSWFAWHVEDHELHSLNFLHTGSSKTWYAVPGDYAFTFEETIRTRAYGGNIDRLDALTLLGEKTTLLSPEVVVSSGIPCCRLVQNPGEFVVTFPRAYHVGFSHGFNCGEAANFGTPKWLTVAKEAAVRRAAMNYLPMLSHQQLLYLLTMSFVSRVPRSLLPGVRTSRLRDRQKEEREMLVKKAFIEDILNANNMLTILLQKSSSYSAVLWDLESLPSSVKESDLCGSIATVPTPPMEHTYSEIDNNQDLYSQMSLYMETVNNSFVDDDDDLSCGFQVDSGTLPCVACGVLGFPFMSVVQPSEKASINLLPADHHMVLDLGVGKPAVSQSPSGLNGMCEGSVSDAADKMKPNESNLFYHPNGASSTAEASHSMFCPAFSPPLKDLPVSSDVKFDKGWNTSSGYLRPRIFCLEHAIQTEELLQSKGGSNVLLICHSDFQKIKAHAVAVAEEIGSPFNYNEIPLDNASNEDLNLINLAIDNEEQYECGEDWTSKLHINLRQCVKLRKKFPTKRVQHALTLDGLFYDTVPISRSFGLKWQCKQSRSKRNLNHPDDSKPSEIIPIEKGEVLGAKSDGHLVRKDDKIIQYSRRSFKSKPAKNSRNTTETNVSKIENTGKSSSGLGVLPSNGKSELQHRNEGLVTTKELSENSVQLDVADSSIAANPVVENVEAQMGNNRLKEMIIKDKVCDSTRLEDSQMQHEFKIAVKTSEKSERCYSEISAGSPAVSVKVAENFQITEEIGMTNETCDRVTVDDFGWHCHSRPIGDVSMEEVSDPATSVGPCADDPAVESFDEQMENTDGEKLCMNSEVDVHVNLNNKMLQEIQNPKESNDDSKTVSSNITPINESSVLVEESLEVPRGTGAAKEMQSAVENSYLPDKRSGRNGSKRKREVELQTDVRFGIDGFIKSPCEGLRPRAGKNATRGGIDGKKTVQEKPAMKVRRNPSDGLVPLKDKKENSKGSHRCDLEGCRTSFQTKAELLLHKRNRCPHEGCGKKFSSHKYAVLHLRVHDDDRPLKCPWKGCSMSFKWAWARTEHLRVHTGERPYQCKVEGCGLTFRFVSDFSRHRRKTGHYVNLPN